MSPEPRFAVQPGSTGLFLFSFNMCWAGLNNFREEYPRGESLQRRLRNLAWLRGQAGLGVPRSLDLIGAHDGALLVEATEASGGSQRLLEAQRELGEELGELSRDERFKPGGELARAFFDHTLDLLRGGAIDQPHLADCLDACREWYRWSDRLKAPRLLDFVCQEMTAVYEGEGADDESNLTVLMLIRIPNGRLRWNEGTGRWPLAQALEALVENNDCRSQIRRIFLTQGAFNLAVQLNCQTYIDADRRANAVRHVLCHGTDTPLMAESSTLIPAPTQPGFPTPDKRIYQIDDGQHAIDISVLLKLDPAVDDAEVAEVLLGAANACGLERARICFPDRCDPGAYHEYRERHYLSGWQGYFDQAITLLSVRDVRGWVYFAFAVNNLMPWVLDTSTQLRFDKTPEIQTHRVPLCCPLAEVTP